METIMGSSSAFLPGGGPGTKFSEGEKQMKKMRKTVSLLLALALIATSSGINGFSLTDVFAASSTATGTFYVDGEQVSTETIGVSTGDVLSADSFSTAKASVSSSATWASGTYSYTEAATGEKTAASGTVSLSSGSTSDSNGVAVYYGTSEIDADDLASTTLSYTITFSSGFWSAGGSIMIYLSTEAVSDYSQGTPSGADVVTFDTGSDTSSSIYDSGGTISGTIDVSGYDLSTYAYIGVMIDGSGTGWAGSDNNSSVTLTVTGAYYGVASSESDSSDSSSLFSYSSGEVSMTNTASTGTYYYLSAISNTLTAGEYSYSVYQYLLWNGISFKVVLSTDSTGTTTYDLSDSITVEASEWDNGKTTTGTFTLSSDMSGYSYIGIAVTTTNEWGYVDSGGYYTLSVTQTSQTSTDSSDDSTYATETVSGSFESESDTLTVTTYGTNYSLSFYYTSSGESGDDDDDDDNDDIEESEEGYLDLVNSDFSLGGTYGWDVEIDETSSTSNEQYTENRYDKSSGYQMGTASDYDGGTQLELWNNNADASFCVSYTIENLTAGEYTATIVWRGACNAELSASGDYVESTDSANIGSSGSYTTTSITIIVEDTGDVTITISGTMGTGTSGYNWLQIAELYVEIVSGDGIAADDAESYEMVYFTSTLYNYDLEEYNLSAYADAYETTEGYQSSNGVSSSDDESESDSGSDSETLFSITSSTNLLSGSSYVGWGNVTSGTTYYFLESFDGTMTAGTYSCTYSYSYIYRGDTQPSISIVVAEDTDGTNAVELADMEWIWVETSTSGTVTFTLSSDLSSSYTYIGFAVTSTADGFCDDGAELTISSVTQTSTSTSSSDDSSSSTASGTEPIYMIDSSWVAVGNEIDSDTGEVIVSYVDGYTDVKAPETELSSWNLYTGYSLDDDSGIVTSKTSDVYSGLAADELTDGSITFNYAEGGLFSAADDGAESGDYGYGTSAYTNVSVPYTFDSDTGFYEFDSDLYDVYFEDSNSPTSGAYLLYNFDKKIMGSDTDGYNYTGFFPFDDEDDTVATYNFGMHSTFEFYLSEHGTATIVNDDGNLETVDTVFSFSGDDDVWVYVDGVLVLDIGGIHDAISADIDFAAFTAAVDGETSSFSNALIEALGAEDTDGDGTYEYNTTEVHTIDIFYLERGQEQSNSKISLNLDVINSVMVEKEAGEALLESIAENTSVSYSNGDLTLSGESLEEEDDNADGTVTTALAQISETEFVSGEYTYTFTYNSIWTTTPVALVAAKDASGTDMIYLSDWEYLDWVGEDETYEGTFRIAEADYLGASSTYSYIGLALMNTEWGAGGTIRGLNIEWSEAVFSFYLEFASYDTTDSDGNTVTRTENELTDDDYEHVFAETEYSLYDSKWNYSSQTTDEDGYFALKDGESAEFVVDEENFSGGVLRAVEDTSQISSAVTFSTSWTGTDGTNTSSTDSVTTTAITVDTDEYGELVTSTSWDPEFDEVSGITTLAVENSSFNETVMTGWEETFSDLDGVTAGLTYDEGRNYYFKIKADEETSDDDSSGTASTDEDSSDEEETEEVVGSLSRTITGVPISYTDSDNNTVAYSYTVSIDVKSSVIGDTGLTLTASGGSEASSSVYVYGTDTWTTISVEGITPDASGNITVTISGTVAAGTEVGIDDLLVEDDTSGETSASSYTYICYNTAAILEDDAIVVDYGLTVSAEVLSNDYIDSGQAYISSTDAVDSDGNSLGYSSRGYYGNYKTGTSQGSFEGKYFTTAATLGSGSSEEDERDTEDIYALAAIGEDDGTLSEGVYSYSFISNAVWNDQNVSLVIATDENGSNAIVLTETDAAWVGSDDDSSVAVDATSSGYFRISDSTLKKIEEMTDSDGNSLSLSDYTYIGFLSEPSDYGAGGTAFDLAITACEYNDTITYSMFTYISGIERIEYEAGDLGITAKLSIIPATTVYYEDDFGYSTTGSGIVYTGSWSTEGTSTTSDETQSTDYVGDEDANNYGYDEAYDTDSTLSADSAHYIKGTGSTSTATFTFTGTGFDIISRTNTTTGLITVYVYEGSSASDETLIDKIAVNNYYNDGDIYQIPVITWDAAAVTNSNGNAYGHGTYTVVIEVEGSNLFTEKTIFYLDAIRIYNPIDITADTTDAEEAAAAYAADDEANAVIKELGDELISSGSLTADSSSVVGVTYVDSLVSGTKTTGSTSNNTSDNTSDGTDPSESATYKYYDSSKNLTGYVIVEKSNTSTTANYYTRTYSTTTDSDGNVTTNYSSYIDTCYKVVISSLQTTTDSDTNEETTTTTSTITYATYLDEYADIGPNNEVYLKYGNGVAFEFSDESGDDYEIASIQIGVKAPTGSATLLISNLTDNASEEIELSTATEMFYDITNIVSDGDRIMLTNSLNEESTSIAAVTDIKVTFKEKEKETTSGTAASSLESEVSTASFSLLTSAEVEITAAATLADLLAGELDADSVSDDETDVLEFDEATESVTINEGYVEDAAAALDELAETLESERDGKIFIGWYYDEDFTEIYNPSSDEITGTVTLYAKFIDEDVLSVKVQATSGASLNDESVTLRFVSTVDSLSYQAAGYIISYTVDGTSYEITKNVTKVYTGINAAGTSISPTIFSDESAYFTTFVLKNITSNYYDMEISVTPYVVNEAGYTVLGVERTVTVNDILS